MQMNGVQIFQLSLFIMAFKSLKLLRFYDGVATWVPNSLVTYFNVIIVMFRPLKWMVSRICFNISALLYWVGVDLCMWLFHAPSWNLKLLPVLLYVQALLFLLP